MSSSSSSTISTNVSTIFPKRFTPDPFYVSLQPVRKCQESFMKYTAYHSLCIRTSSDDPLKVVAAQKELIGTLGGSGGVDRLLLRRLKLYDLVTYRQSNYRKDKGILAYFSLATDELRWEDDLSFMLCLRLMRYNLIPTLSMFGVEKASYTLGRLQQAWKKAECRLFEYRMRLMETRVLVHLVDQSVFASGSRTVAGSDLLKDCVVHYLVHQSGLAKKQQLKICEKIDDWVDDVLEYETIHKKIKQPWYFFVRIPKTLCVALQAFMKQRKLYSSLLEDSDEVDAWKPYRRPLLILPSVTTKEQFDLYCTREGLVVLLKWWFSERMLSMRVRYGCECTFGLHKMHHCEEEKVTTCAATDDMVWKHWKDYFPEGSAAADADRKFMYHFIAYLQRAQPEIYKSIYPKTLIRLFGMPIDYKPSLGLQIRPPCIQEIEDLCVEDPNNVGDQALALYNTVLYRKIRPEYKTQCEEQRSHTETFLYGSPKNEPGDRRGCSWDCASLKLAGMCPVSRREGGDDELFESNSYQQRCYQDMKKRAKDTLKIELGKEEEKKEHEKYGISKTIRIPSDYSVNLVLLSLAPKK